MAIRIIMTVDEERQRLYGGSERTEAEILALLASMRDDGRLSLQSRNYWLPVRELRALSG